MSEPGMRRLWAPAWAGAMLALAALVLTVPGSEAQRQLEWEWPNTDFDTTLIDLDKVMSGEPPKDAIPAIDGPKFVSVEAAAQWLHDQEPVIVVATDSLVRAYPIQILMFHEIVNEELDGLPLSITFCPLCNATIVFRRQIGDVILDFGTTGRLRKSDLVMYDRQTESWWQQFSGRGIVGEHAGTVLDRYPASNVAFTEFRAGHPGADVLSRDTGHGRP